MSVYLQYTHMTVEKVLRKSKDPMSGEVAKVTPELLSSLKKALITLWSYGMGGHVSWATDHPGLELESTERPHELWWFLDIHIDGRVAFWTECDPDFPDNVEEWNWIQVEDLDQTIAEYDWSRAPKTSTRRSKPCWWETTP